MSRTPLQVAATLAWSLMVLVPVGSAQGPGPAGHGRRRPPVTLDASGLFGDQLLVPNAYGAIRVEAENHTGRTLRGVLRVSIRRWRGGGSDRHSLPMDLPPHATRRAVLELFLHESASVQVRYEQGSTTLARATVSPEYTSARSGIVVMADPPRLRAALIDLDVTQPAVGPYGAPSAVRMPIGVVSFDPSSGDPILPDGAAGWAGVGMLVAGAPELARAGTAGRLALLDWLRAGGRVLIFPRTEADLRDPFIRSLIGDVEPFEGTETIAHERLVPESARGRFFRGGPTFRPEPFGGSKPLGLGRVYVAVFDGNLPGQATATSETRLLVRSILEAPRVHGVDEPILPAGRGEDDMSAEGYGVGPAFGALRAALDPNEGYRPALGLVAIVLLIYVIFVGPLNFAFVGKRGRPVLALVTTPVLAGGCMILMLGVGYLGKGTRMRYRAVELVELREGSSSGPARRYSGLFLTRPAGFDLAFPARGTARVIRAPTSDIAPVVDHAPERPTLRGMRGGLWETIFVREDRIADLGGALTFDRHERRLTAVRNHMGVTLRGAVIVDAGGNVYPVGDIPAGGVAAVGEVSTLLLDTTTWYGSGDNPSIVSLTRQMGLPPERSEVLDGLLKAMGGSLSTPPVPSLFAWVEHAPRGRVAGLFAEEMDLRFVRVVPDLGGPEVTAAPEGDPGPEESSGSMRAPPPQEEPP